MSYAADEIEKKITTHLSGAFESLLQEKIGQISEIDDVVSWIQQSKQSVDTKKNSLSLGLDRDKILSKISNKIMSQLILYVPKYMGQLIVENIKINTQGKEKNAKFDISFALDPFNPYVEIVKKINGIDSVKIKVEFEIESDIKIQNNKLTLDEKKTLSLGIMVAHITITMLSSVGSLSDKTVLKELEFEADLSDIVLQLS